LAGVTRARYLLFGANTPWKRLLGRCRGEFLRQPETGARAVAEYQSRYEAQQDILDVVLHVQIDPLPKNFRIE